MPAAAGRTAVGTLARPVPSAEEPAGARKPRPWPWRTLLALAGGLVLGLAFFVPLLSWPGIIAESPELFTPDVFVADIAERSSSTVAQRLGSIPEWVLTAVGVGALLAAAVPGLRARRRWRAAG